MSNNIFTNLVSIITREKGKNFLKLKDHIDENIIKQPDEKKEGAISLYIHIPFCRTLCPFCCFNRYLFKEDIARQYFVNLKKELSLYIKNGFKFRNFYFGGGTPTILMDELTSFINFLKQNFNVHQISLETTPREINPKNIDLLLKSGVNRLSIGVQSFDDIVIKSMGRFQNSSKDVIDKVLMAQGKFDTTNIDFVFNFPGQSIDQFKKDVQIFKELGIDQVTFYPLMASPHKKDAMERKFNRVDNSREIDFYNIILKEIYDAGYKASTAWCFSRGDKMIDEYIIDFDDYIGIGSGSVSIYNGNFFVNTFSLDKYEKFLNNDQFPIIGWRKLSERENMYYYLLTKLFGIEFTAEKFKRHFHKNINRALCIELLALRLSNIVSGKDIIKVKKEGMYTVSVMMREFFASLNSLRELCIEKQL